jgi:hypothetical protein
MNNCSLLITLPPVFQPRNRRGIAPRGKTPEIKKDARNKKLVRLGGKPPPASGINAKTGSPAASV